MIKAIKLRDLFVSVDVTKHDQLVVWELKFPCAKLYQHVTRHPDVLQHIEAVEEDLHIIMGKFDAAFRNEMHAWWRHQMETFVTSLAFSQGNSPINSPHKGQWRGALMFSLTCAWTNGWTNHRGVSDLRHHRAHYDATVMFGCCYATLGFLSNAGGVSKTHMSS